MAREKADYRDNLAILSEMFPNRLALDIKETCELIGCHRETLMLDKTFPKQKINGKYLVPIVALSKWLS